MRTTETLTNKESVAFNGLKLPDCYSGLNLTAVTKCTGKRTLRTSYGISLLVRHPCLTRCGTLTIKSALFMVSLTRPLMKFEPSTRSPLLKGSNLRQWTIGLKWYWPIRWRKANIDFTTKPEVYDLVQFPCVNWHMPSVPIVSHHLNSQTLAAMGNVRTTTRTNIIWYAKDFIMITSLRNAVVSSQLQPYLLAVTSSSSAVILEFTYGSVCLSTFYFFSFIAS